VQWLRAAEAGRLVGVSGATIRRKAGGIYKGHRVHERETTEEDVEEGVPPQTKTLYAVEPLTDKDKRHADEKPPDAPPPHLAAKLFECDALRMRIQGFSYQQIANRLDMTHDAVRAAVKRSTQRVEEDSRERAKELIELDLQRLDTMQASLWDVAVAGDTRAQKQIIDIMRHRAKILGVTGAAPKNFNQWNVQINNGQVDETIADTPHGMMSPKQIRTYEDPAEAAKLERELIKLQIDQVEYRERSGELVDKHKVSHILHRIGRLVRDRLLKFPTRLANKLVGLDAQAIARVLDEEVRDILGEMVDDIERTMRVEFDTEEDDDVVDAEFVEAHP